MSDRRFRPINSGLSPFAKAEDVTISGAWTFTAAPTIGDGTEDSGDDLIVFNTTRPWTLESISSGAATALRLQSASNKRFFIGGVTNGDLAIFDTENMRLLLNGHLTLTDGITAPSTTAGYAHIYVDTSDGDLKVKFGDGTVKTIATDT